MLGWYDRLQGVTETRGSIRGGVPVHRWHNRCPPDSIRIPSSHQSSGQFAVTPRSNTVRIIGGEHRGRRLRFVDQPGLRPTPDRVRETLFNWLGQDLTGRRCLDLFAGSGALGFEAISRPAREVVMTDQSREATGQLREFAKAIGTDRATILQCDALEFLGAMGRQRSPEALFDVVFLDPPFGADWIARIEPLLAPVLAERSLVYVEMESKYQPGAGLQILKSGRAGAVHYALAGQADASGADQ